MCPFPTNVVLPFFPLLITNTRVTRFETQLASVKERLEAAKAGSTRGLNSPTAGGFSIGSRIAKPLRGGGVGGSGDVAANPAIANLQNQGENKRSSWFFKSS